MEGWICLHRKMLDWEWYSDANTFRLFIHLLLLANHEEKKWKGQVIERGQLVTSISHLSEETGLTIKQVRTCLKKLRTTGEVTSKGTNQFTLITIVKYADYQDKKEEDGKQEDKRRANEGQSKGKQRATNNNDNNITTKQDKKEKEKKKQKTFDEVFKEKKFSKELEDTYRDFIDMRKAIKKPMTTRALELLIKSVEKLTNLEAEKIAILNQSIEHSWQTVYPLKKENEKTVKQSNFQQREYTDLNKLYVNGG